MPGTPRKKARQVVELERRAVGLVEDLLGRMPRQAYDALINRFGELDDTITASWCEAVKAAITANLRIGELSHQLRRVSGAEGSSVSAAFWDSREDSTLLLPDDALDHLEDGEFEPEPIVRVLTPDMPF